MSVFIVKRMSNNWRILLLDSSRIHNKRREGHPSVRDAAQMRARGEQVDGRRRATQRDRPSRQPSVLFHVAAGITSQPHSRAIDRIFSVPTSVTTMQAISPQQLQFLPLKYPSPLRRAFIDSFS